MTKIIDRIRAFRNPVEAKAADTRPWVEASVSIGDTLDYGRRPADIDRSQFLREYRGWPYVCAGVNARGVAALPLRVYREKVKQGDKGWEYRSRSVGRKRQRHTMLSSGGITRKMMDSTDNMEEVTDRDHPLVEILDRPNKWMSGFQLIENMVLSMQLGGTSFAHIVQPKKSPPTELMFMATPWTKIAMSNDGYINHYRYGVDSSVEEQFGPVEVVRIALANPTGVDSLWGVSPMRAASMWNQVSENISVFQANTFFNGGFPSVIAAFKGATETQLKAFEGKIRQKMRGTRKAGDIVAVSGDVTLTKWSMSQEELGFLQAAKDKRDDIAAVFGVPTSLLTVENVNLANGKTAAPHWQILTVRPYAQRIEDALNSQLLPAFRDALGDPSLCVAFDNPVEDEVESRVDRAVRAYQGGLLTRNEARMDMDWEPAEGEDEFFIPGGALPLPGPSGPVVTFNMDEPRPVEPVEKTKDKEYEVDSRNHQGVHCRDSEHGDRRGEGGHRGGVKGDSHGIDGGSPDVSERLSLYLGTDHEEVDGPGLWLARLMPSGEIEWKDDSDLRRVQRLEAHAARQIQDGMKEWFDRMITDIVASVTPSGGVGIDMSPTSDAAVVLRDLISGPATDAFAQGVEIGFSEIPESTGDDAMTATDRARASVQAHLIRLSESTLSTVREGVEHRLREALDESAGGDFQLVQQAVADAMERDSDFVSRRIARTESVRMSQDGRLASWRESGVVKGKRWVTRGDNRVAEPCLTIQRRFSRADVGEPFVEAGTTIAGFRFNYDPRGLMAPPAKPNCRCTLVPEIG